MHGRSIKIWSRFEPGTPGRKANSITTELYRILPNTAVRYCILNREVAMLQGVVSPNPPPLLKSYIDIRKPLLGRKSIFGRQIELMAQWPIPDEPPSYEESP